MPVLGTGRGRGGLCSHVSRINIWMGDERESEDEVHTPSMIQEGLVLIVFEHSMLFRTVCKGHTNILQIYYEYITKTPDFTTYQSVR